MSREYRVTAMVSTYNSEEFIRECVEDLEHQTITNQVEILVVDSGSEQRESEIVKELQANYGNITLVRTERETLYGAWNRAAEMAQGRYIINANTDDRHRYDAFEMLAGELDADSSIDLVYGDWLSTELPHETFERHSGHPMMTLRYPEFFPPIALLHFMLSPAPMWRREILDAVGPFDASLRSAGDLEWSIRVALSARAKHIPELVGLFYISGGQLSQSAAAMSEPSAVLAKYRTKNNVIELYRQGGWDVSAAQGRRRALLDMASRAAAHAVPWGWSSLASDAAFSNQCAEWAMNPD